MEDTKIESEGPACPFGQVQVEEAKAEFLANPEWKLVYDKAPAGAKRRMDVSFFFTKKKANLMGHAEEFEKYRGWRRAIERVMTAEDLEYMIANIGKPEAVEHYAALLKDRNGDVEIVETLDTLGLWDEMPRVGTAFMHKVWRALRGDVGAQDDVGRIFFWTDDDNDEDREKYRWLDKPELSRYWYQLAAEAGLASAQTDLGRIYCPGLAPKSEVKVGRFARHWWEEAAAQKYKDGMYGLANCLRCGRCCCCSCDVPCADALESEADGMP